MHPNHITSLRLTNFKRFKDLEIDDIGLINLIVGDNNVGKTSVLEALVTGDDISSDMKHDQRFFERYFKKYFEDLTYILDYYKKFKDIKGDIIEYYANMQGKDSSYSIQLKHKNKVSFTLSVANIGLRDWELSVKKGATSFSTPFRFKVDHFQEHVQRESYPFYYPYFIPYYLGYNQDLTNYYSEHIQQDSELKQKFVESLRVILPDLSDILVDTSTSYHPILIIQRKGQRRNMPLATFGDGFTNLFRLMIEIYKSEGKRIMLDEIDYGIHFDRKTGFWKSVIHAAQSNKVQIFGTTHNNECITSLQEAGSDKDFNFGKDIRIIRLAEIKDKNVGAYTYNFNEFTHAIENENELR